MNIRHEFADSMFGIDHASLEADRQAQLQADYGPADRHEGVFYHPQGRVEQGWPMRRCSPEMATVVDQLPEDFDQGERTGRHTRMGVLAAWERGLLQPSVRYAVGWLSVMALVMAAWKFWS